MRAYVKHRQEQGVVNRQGVRTSDVSNAEINRELQQLKRLFSLAVQSDKIFRKPHIPMLEESAPRAGFFERQQFEAVRRHLPAPLQPLITFAYITGCWVPSEVQTLHWSRVDMRTGTLRLEPGITNNGQGRTFPFTADLRALLEAQARLRDALSGLGADAVDRALAGGRRAEGVIRPWVFFRLVAEGRGGAKKPKPITAFTKAWQHAGRAAVCPGRIPHDFRRTAVRNPVRAGVPDAVAMRLTGHLTRSVFER